MKPIAAAAFALLLLAACREDGNTPAATTETSPGGIAYARLFMPEAEEIAIQIAWPSDWSRRDEVNQAVPYLGTDLILSGGAEGYPPGEAGEAFADLGAEASLFVTPDHLHGQLFAAPENLAQAVTIANAHLARPTLDEGWLDRLKQGISANIAEANAQPVVRGSNALRWAMLGDTPLRRAVSIDPPGQITSAQPDDLRDWHARTVTRTGASIVIAGAIDAETAGTTVDALLQGLPDGTPIATATPVANFAPRRILFHAPDAQTSTLIFVGQLPPTREGGEFEDYLLAGALGGDEKSVLFDAVRTGLRASYGFGAIIEGMSRDLRLLTLSGEVETAKLAEAEAIVRDTYAAFLADPAMGDLAARKSPMAAGAEETASNPDAASFSALNALLDGQDPGLALDLGSMLAKVTEETIATRAATAFPPADALIVIAISPDATALPDACVITTPAEAAACP